MKIQLQSALAADVLALTSEYGYVPEEIISIGIALATVLLKERGLGNDVVVISSEGDRLAKFKEVEPKAIREIAKEYVASVCPELAETSASLLVARLERERDFEQRHPDSTSL